MYLCIVLLLATVLRTYLIDLYSHFATALHCLQFAVSYSLSQFVPCADVTADKLSCTIVVVCCVLVGRGCGLYKSSQVKSILQSWGSQSDS